jgi:uncharacterized protein YebE (UPF0316 family)
MEMKLLILFIVMNIVNVITQTIKSLATIKCGKTAAAIVNAIAFGLYTYIVVLTMCDLPLLAKCLIVAGANFVGVWVVKYFEEKARKEKLWAIRFTVKDNEREEVINNLKEKAVPHYYHIVGNHTVFETFCNSQKETLKVKEIVEKFNAKYFVSEAKTSVL